MATNVQIQFNPFQQQLNILIDGKQLSEYSCLIQFADEDIWQWHSEILDAVFFSTKYGRTKAVKTKILAGVVTTVMIYCMGIILLSVICFGIMGTSGMNTLYQMYQAYSIYIMSYGQYYLLTVVCGFIASMLAASVSMLVAAKMHTISVAVCIPFFLYCLLPFIGRALSGYTTLFNLIPTILTNVQASVKVPLIYQIGNCVFRQIPLVMVMYTVMAIALLPFIYKSFRRYGNK